MNVVHACQSRRPINHKIKHHSCLLCTAHCVPNCAPVLEGTSIAALPGRNNRLRRAIPRACRRGEIEMKNLFLAAFAALGLAVAVAPAANAFTRGVPASTHHSGPYDNTGNGP